ncbi:hypothetical protein KI387_027706 [Taxus chinensis]|uniref:TIR domain-containing protein n=1 Tax=Taxus chinensis TaxID=29808 RepID=A0AA38FYV6_TAXCH|nr:hypothetical protein KI387_027706 [Taxus chinensis]
MLAFIETNASSVLYSSVFEFDLAFMGVSSSSFQRNVEEHALSAIGHQGFSQTPKVFHVFINHRGPDAKETLALRLYNSLENAGIRAFLDTKEIELRDSIPSAIRNAIFSASIHIAVFSKGYAESAWCLEELDLMLQSKSIIIPVFYDVTPSDLRYLKKGVYADSFAKHKAKGRHLDKLDNWKQALHSVSLICGYEFSHHNRDFEKLCKNVLCAVQREVEKTRVIETAKNPVGINDLVKDFERNCLEKMKNKEKIVGIYGMGGSGKTTLAKELLNRKRLEYNSSCFLFDVREASANGNLTSLQSKLIKDLLQEDRKFHSIPEGSSYLRSCLGSCRSVKFLIFVDDIDHERQLHDFLVRDIVQNNSDNVIIVTTRDERVLIRAGITHRYKMKEMNVSHSTELFCWHAFHQPYPARGYEYLVPMFVKECGGLPLSLQVLGGHVFGSNSEHYWKLELDKVRKTLPQDIKQRLRISIDALDAEQKQILMDIACFFINKSSHMAIRIWEGSGWSAEHTIQTLKDKCLIEVQLGRTYWNGSDSGNIPLLGMHDHIRDLAREMADEASTSPRRLWHPQYLRALEVKGFQNILAQTPGYSFRCLNSIFDENTTFEFRYFLIGDSNGYDEPSTALLWLEIDMSLCETLDELESVEGQDIKSVPSPRTIPCWIPLQSLQYLKVSNGRLPKLWQDEEQAPFQLKELVLDGTNLKEFPKSVGRLSHLEDLVLTGRAEWNGWKWDNIMQIDGRFFSKSIRKLKKLKSLVLGDLILNGELNLNVGNVSTCVESCRVNLEKIDIRNVKRVYKVSISEEYLRTLTSLHLESLQNLIEVDLGVVAPQNCVEGPSKVEELSRIERIVIDGCWMLLKINGFDKLKQLKYLHINSIPCLWPSMTKASRLLQCRMMTGQNHKLPGNDRATSEGPLPRAIVICMTVQFFYKGGGIRKILKIPCGDWMVSAITEGKSMVVIVVTDKGKINKMHNGMSDWIPTVTDGKVTSCYMVTIYKEEQEMKIFNSLFQREIETAIEKSEYQYEWTMKALRTNYGVETCKGMHQTS